jgi:hypothetical protein
MPANGLQSLGKFAQPMTIHGGRLLSRRPKRSPTTDVLEITKSFCYRGGVKEQGHPQPDQNPSRLDAGKDSSEAEQAKPQEEIPANKPLSRLRGKRGDREFACVTSWLIPSPENLDWMLKEGLITQERAKKVRRLRGEIEFRANLAGMVDDGLLTREEARQQLREFYESRDSEK